MKPSTIFSISPPPSQKRLRNPSSLRTLWTPYVLHILVKSRFSTPPAASGAETRQSKPSRSHLPEGCGFNPNNAHPFKNKNSHHPPPKKQSFINYTSQRMKIKVTMVYPKHLTGHCFTFVQTERKEKESPN